MRFRHPPASRRSGAGAAQREEPSRSRERHEKSVRPRFRKECASPFPKDVPVSGSGRLNDAHRRAAEAEEALARQVHDMDDQMVISWGDQIGTHGADVISVNHRTGEVHLWDAKYRSKARNVGESRTFSKERTRRGAVEQAQLLIVENTSLPDSIRRIAIDNLDLARFTGHTVGFGHGHSGVTRSY